MALNTYVAPESEAESLRFHRPSVTKAGPVVKHGGRLLGICYLAGEITMEYAAKYDAEAKAAAGKRTDRI
jgi:hypothetical protein